ncbi:MAG: TIGR04282 family arsenosugar biosynthesis glycosyltransferase [Acidobacteria bacterium]|nr:TIGR04282 family arsenosugar biosynthesis glycosyltransferase [Acidobacteriota bacterium]MCA1650927.1 TIGR04282 family arsenosugar biosynthesis glycosyltransferase [Acidobacteriota bacterium]
MNADRVLAIMAKAPRVGHVKTRLATHITAARVVDLYRCLLEDTLALARTAPAAHVAIVCPAGDGVDLRRWFEGISVVEQTQAGLAAALTMTFAHFAAAGFRRIVAFNADTPHLPAHVLERAFDALTTHDVVVGPTLDGGYYLVGGRASHPTLFATPQLSTSSALDALLSRVRALGLTCARTDEWYDVDVHDDLEQLARDLESQPGRAPRTAAYLAKHWRAGDRDDGSR